MRVIDAHTGREIKEGDTVKLPGSGWYRVLKIKPGLLSASMLAASSNAAMDGRWLPLQVRWTHPDFLFSHVAFAPT
jgi:hypothetical protein